MEGINTVFLLLSQSGLTLFNHSAEYDSSWLQEQLSGSGISENLTFLEKEKEFNPNHLR